MTLQGVSNDLQRYWKILKLFSNKNRFFLICLLQVWNYPVPYIDLFGWVKVQWNAGKNLGIKVPKRLKILWTYSFFSLNFTLLGFPYFSTWLNKSGMYYGAKNIRKKHGPVLVSECIFKSQKCSFSSLKQWIITRVIPAWLCHKPVYVVEAGRCRAHSSFLLEPLSSDWESVYQHRQLQPHLSTAP